MADIRISCSPLPQNRGAWFASFRAAEVDESYDSPMKAATLRRIAEEAPDGFRWTVAAWRWLVCDPTGLTSGIPMGLPNQKIGLLRPTTENAKLWKSVMEQVEALAAWGVLLKTPPGFSPSVTNRKNLEAFAKQFGKGIKLIWEPRGIWEMEEIQEQAAKAGVVPAFDPYVDAEFPEPTKGDVYYALTAPRGRRRFDRDDVEELAQFLRSHDGEVHVVFRGDAREANARLLASFLDSRRGSPAAAARDVDGDDEDGDGSEFGVDEDELDDGFGDDADYGDGDGDGDDDEEWDGDDGEGDED